MPNFISVNLFAKITLMKIIIKKAGSKDIKRLENLDRHFFDSQKCFDRFLDFNWPSSPKGKKYYLSVLRGRNSCCFIAQDQTGQDMGYIAGKQLTYVTDRAVKTAELENVFILKEFQGHGVGSQLLAAFLNWCRRQKMETVYVSVYQQNKAGLDFYQQKGFKLIDLGLELDLRKNHYP
jgi:ribosomal protein S18 acetylase RimI-like enzyme